MKIKQEYDYYNMLIFVHDCVTELIKPPHREYPLNATGLLHAADIVLIYCTERYQRIMAWKCREIAIQKINKSA